MRLDYCDRITTHMRSINLEIDRQAALLTAEEVFGALSEAEQRFLRIGTEFRRVPRDMPSYDGSWQNKYWEPLFDLGRDRIPEPFSDLIKPDYQRKDSNRVHILTERAVRFKGLALLASEVAQKCDGLTIMNDNRWEIDGILKGTAPALEREFQTCTVPGAIARVVIPIMFNRGRDDLFVNWEGLFFGNKSVDIDFAVMKGENLADDFFKRMKVADAIEVCGLLRATLNAMSANECRKMLAEGHYEDVEVSPLKIAAEWATQPW